MKALNDLIIEFDKDSANRLTEDWTWLIGTDKTPIIVSAIGDMFLKDKTDQIYWLDVGRGEFQQVANGLSDFEEKLKNIEKVNEWFMIDLTTELRLSDKKLKDRQLYSYKKLPVIGGDYSVDNFEPMDIEVHFSFAGQIHYQTKDLPDGTKIKEVKFINSRTMTLKSIKTFYWITFGLSIVILPLNIGLGLIAIGLIILPILILHLAIGIGLRKLENHKTSIILSGANLLIFALIRPDGVHAFYDNGLSSFLNIFGIYAGYNREYENYFFVGSLILLLVQAIMDIRLWKLAKASIK